MPSYTCIGKKRACPISPVERAALQLRGNSDDNFITDSSSSSFGPKKSGERMGPYSSLAPVKKTGN